MKHINKLLLIGGILLTSCTLRGNFSRDLVVREIEEFNNGCIYSLQRSDSGDYYEVADVCGKFNIGDTLYLTKNK